MRKIINISLSKKLAAELEKTIKRGKYSSKSEFLRELIRERLEEEELWRSVQRSEAEFKAGKGKILKSLADLD
ncbi:MAG: ribbon-helix-helix protein, CopG family [Patescibacteria group bacterium]